MNTIIFFDIDGTLLAHNQQPTISDLPAILDRLHHHDIRFGLNSNRSLHDVQSIIDLFCLDGPFILENGAFTLERCTDQVMPANGAFEGIPEIAFTLVQEAIDLAFSGATVTLTDTVSLAETNARQSGLHFFLNRFRKYSASIHHRQNGNTDQRIAQKLSDQLNSLLKTREPRLVAVPHIHGATVTIDIKGVDKGTALKAYRKKIGESVIIAIGDGRGELALRDHVDLLYAVANAIPELKQIADAVATQEVTAGVREILLTHVLPMVKKQKEIRRPL